jgi:hypothetical protein
MTQQTNAADGPFDPVLAKRAKIARWVSLGQRVGYGSYLIASLAFAQTVIAEPTTPVINLIVICLVIGSIVLLPAIIFGYAVKAAERHDRELAAEQAAKAARRQRSDEVPSDAQRPLE